MAAEPAKLTLDDVQLQLAMRICQTEPGERAEPLIMQLVLDLYEHIDPYSIGATRYHLSCSYVETGGDAPMTALDLARYLTERAVHWCWISADGRTLAVPVGEANIESLKVRRRVDALGLGWMVDAEGTYHLTVHPQRMSSQWGKRELVGAGKLLWSGTDPASQRLDYLLGWLHQLSWALTADNRPGSFDYQLQKLVGLILAAHEAGMGPGHAYFDVRTILED